MYQGHALNIKVHLKPGPGRPLLVPSQQTPSLITAIMFHLPVLYSSNKYINFHFLQINQSLPKRHDIFIRGHSEWDTVFIVTTNVLFYHRISTGLCTMSPFNISIFQFHFATTIPLCISSLKKGLYSSAQNVHMFIRTTCYHIRDVTNQFFQNPEIWITHFPYFKHIQLSEFSLGFSYCHFFLHLPCWH